MFVFFIMFIDLAVVKLSNLKSFTIFKSKISVFLQFIYSVVYYIPEYDHTDL
jgi:hypothetical protein